MPRFEEEFNAIEERQRLLDEKKKAFETKKKEAIGHINYFTDQIKRTINNMESKSFELDTRNRRDHVYKNDMSHDLVDFSTKLKDLFQQTADEESALLSDQEMIDDDKADLEEDAGMNANKNNRQRKKKVSKAAADIMEEIGQVSSDSGLCWLGDPAYFMHKKELPASLGKNWKGFADKVGPVVSKFKFDNDKKGLGITVTTGGDGSFPVYAKTDGEKVKSIMIIFDKEVPV